MGRLLFLFLLVIPKQVFSQTDYADYLVNKANNLALYKDDYWHLLVHYKKSIIGYKSLIDGKDFFLAKDGKTNPKAELEATIRAFFAPKEEKKVHPTYKYTARYKWLCHKLDIDKSQLPYDGDQDYKVVLEKVKPNAFYLVFPAAYMNDPASMFGHLFYLIESENVSHLAGLSVNYGAIAQEPPSLLYAIKGLFGLYQGRYDLTPYYQQITKYSYLDMRDTWEYKLLLTEEENDRMLRHIIELGSTYSNYYYLDENCAYCLLFPIEAARPDTNLTDSFGAIVEPIQVIQKLQKEKLLGPAQYRASLFSKMQYEKKFLTSKQKRFVKKLCLGKASVQDFSFEEMSDEEKANLWEFASDYLKYLLANDKISQKEYQRRFISVLSERNKLLKTEPLAKNIPLPSAQPQKSHGSLMFSLGGGILDSNPYGQADFRLLAHDMMDSDDGYTRNSQIEFFTASVRYDFSEKKFALNYVDLANIISMPVCDTFIKKKCFQFRTGLEENLGEDGESDLAWRTKFAVGLSTLITQGNQLYIFLGADTFISPVYDYYLDLLAGGELGVITSLGPWKQNLSASLYQSPFNIEHTRFKLSAEGNLAIHQNAALRLFYSFSGDFRTTWQQAGASLRIYH